MLSLSKDKSEYFAIDFIDFFKNFVSNASKSLKELAEIQEKYPKQYEQFKEFQIDPTIMMKLFEQLDPKIKIRLISILFTSIALSQKVNINIFELNAKEQKKLANEIEKFMEDAEKSLKEIKEELDG